MSKKHPTIELPSLTGKELLTLHVQVMGAFRTRGITRDENNLTGGLAEYLFCTAFGWTRPRNSTPHIDAIDENCPSKPTRYQIKGRRITQNNQSRQLGALRDLDGDHFDALAAVLFTNTYDIHLAAIIPITVVRERAKYQQRSNSWLYHLRDDVWDIPGVQDVTAELCAVEL